MKHIGLAFAALLASTSIAPASVVSVTGPNSNLGTAAAIIAAPRDVLDDVVTNRGMEGFDEAQGVTLLSAITLDGGVVVGPGTTVDSHMIFLNSAGNTYLSHFGVEWTFSGSILGVMSDSSGNLEAATSAVLGAPGTNYTVPFGGSGPAAPYFARGLEENTLCRGNTDGYALTGNTLCVSMEVTEPGDWIRVVTMSAVPLPAGLPLLGGALALLGFVRRRRGA